MTGRVDDPRAVHWDGVYDTKGPGQVSWFQHTPTLSLQLIDHLGLDPADPIIDVGGGAGTLADHLLARGHTDLTVLDVSAHALALTRSRLGVQATQVQWITGDLLAWAPPRAYALWHDRAVFHFLTEDADRAQYRQLAAAAIAPGGHLLIATFAADGPTQCSGLLVTRYSPDELAAQFATAFTPVATRREHHRTPAGGGQPFTWLLLRRTRAPSTGGTPQGSARSRRRAARPRPPAGSALLR